jgi:Domain of unknown function DUF29
MPHDRYAFVLETARALRAGDLAHVDSLAVAEELEQVGRSDARELKSRVVQIMEHLLKLRLTSGILRESNERGWRASILRQQEEIETLFAESPSLKQRLTPELLTKCYSVAAAAVATEYGVAPPDDCPFSVAEIIPADD